MLIADDDPSIVRLLADHRARMGFNVDSASNGMQALLKARQGKPDTLVIDVNMPEVDGLSVCAHLLDPDKGPLNVIVITGSKDLDTLEAMSPSGQRTNPLRGSALRAKAERAAATECLRPALDFGPGASQKHRARRLDRAVPEFAVRPVGRRRASVRGLQIQSSNRSLSRMPRRSLLVPKLVKEGPTTLVARFYRSSEK
jgi:CheY-like chemotaxis protein